MNWFESCKECDALSIITPVVLQTGGKTHLQNCCLVFMLSRKMSQDMPALMPTNQLKDTQDRSSSIHSRAHHPPPTSQHIPCKEYTSENKMLKNLYEQIQLVNKIQQKLLSEQEKLVMMLRRTPKQNSKRNIPAKTPDSLMNPPKCLRIFSHGSIKR